MWAENVESEAHRLNGIQWSNNSARTPLPNTSGSTQTASNTSIGAPATANAADNQAGSVSVPSAAAEWQKIVDELNQRLDGSQTTAVLDSQAPASQVWVNIVDKDSGKVIERFPPDGLRKFVESGQLSGISVDQQL